MLFAAQCQGEDRHIGWSALICEARDHSEAKLNSAGNFNLPSR